MAEEVMVVLNRSENTGFGFSLLGTAGLPPIIYDIVENSPAAESGEVEAGDVILKVNETDVNRFSTKEVLKCLRLSTDPVTLKLKRDPVIKARVRRFLSSASEEDIGELVSRPYTSKRIAKTTTVSSHPHPEASPRSPQESPPLSPQANGSFSDLESLLPIGDSFHEEERQKWEPLNNSEKFGKSKGPPRFEAFMMTGDLILNLSRTQQSTGLFPRQKKVDSLRYYNNHNHHHPSHTHIKHYHNSVPSSPSEMEMGQRTQNCRSGSTSAGTSPVAAAKRDSSCTSSTGSDMGKSPAGFAYHSAGGYVRTSRSEDHLQPQKDSMSAVDIDIDEDVTSSLNTLLDTRQDTNNSNIAPTSAADRIVWTYNAPVSSPSASDHNSCCQTMSNGSSSSHSTSSSGNSPLRSVSPASPTSVSSSVMSSQSGSRRIVHTMPCHTFNGEHSVSVSEAISNISSPDYHDEETMDILSSRDIMISDPSDSDSTILVSEPNQRRAAGGKGDSQSNSYASVKTVNANHMVGGPDSDHRIVIQVKGPDKENNVTGHSPRGSRRLQRSDMPHQTGTNVRQMAAANNNSSGNVGPEMQGYHELKDAEDDTQGLSAEDPLLARVISKATSPPMSEDDSDIESLHSFHYSPKAVDLPSAIRLAKRLYSLDGFKKSDVSRHLSKNNDFSRAVAEEYLKYFNFERDSLDVALRKFLKQFSLTGETQERERVLVHFSKRYLDCNPGSFNSQDAVHTLTCAIMLLNTDLHGQNIGRKMTCTEFVENLSDLNDGENFPREVLKQLYQAIKSYPLEWALDEEGDECAVQAQTKQTELQNNLTTNPFLDVPNSASAIEYKKGYVMRKCCYEANAKKTPFGKRSWKMFYCTLRDLVLYLHKDEHGFRKNQMSDNLHNAIRIHHALATKAQDYTKKQHVFRLQTADQAEYLFQTSDSKELQSWIDTINFVCASFSAQPLEGGVGSQKKFQRPLLPCSHTKLNLREQLRDHEDRVVKLELELEEHRKNQPERSAKALAIQNYKEKDTYLHYELKRYKTYAYLLRSRMAQYPELESSLVESCIGEVDEASGVALLESSAGGIVPPPVPDRRSPPTNRNKATSR
ncbi:PH and SEC7 domain-containing protein isoform X2 [Chrysoperla carnea]|uniref:PH and SEC7 domain-containing protein isoform X2 n=1 Tax=Chrysoperla carnea TaxID=189513 RepID=UPI001D09843C|nr:PH and SEC7 domain-containing protein isoform X2 [Chrysoperla carnea]